MQSQGAYSLDFYLKQEIFSLVLKITLLLHFLFSEPVAACLSPKSLLSLIVNHNDLHKNIAYRKLLIKNDVSSTDGVHNSEEEYNEFINSVRITPRAFMKLCPALLAQIDNGVCKQPAVRSANLNDKNQKIWYGRYL